MKFRKYKRFFLVFFIAFLFNDFISQRNIESMAVAVPAVQQVVLHAQTAYALFTAVAFVAKTQIDKWYQQPMPHPPSREMCYGVMPRQSAKHEDGPSSSTLTVQQPTTYTFKNFDLKDLVAKEMQRQLGAPLTPEQKKVVHSIIANPFKSGIAPIAQVDFDTSPFFDTQTSRIITGPGFARAECNLGNHRIYTQVGFKNSFSDRRATEQELLEHRLQYRYEHDSDFRAYIDAQCKEEMRTLINAVAKSATLGKICALKIFFATRAPAQFNRGLYQIRYWLAPLFFDHRTGEISNKLISTTQALRPIIEYFRQEYGDAWREELGNYLNLNEFALSLDMADQKGWYMKVNTLYRWFYSARDFLWTRLTKKVVTNSTNQKIMAMIEACQMQDFNAAKAIARDAKSSVADEIFAYFYNQKFDAYGIQREFANDSAWAHLSEQTKQEIKNLPNGITFFNNYLALRAQERQKIAEEHPASLPLELCRDAMNNAAVSFDQLDGTKAECCHDEAKGEGGCGSGLIKAPEVQTSPCVVDIEEFEQKGACIQGEQEVSVPPACEVTQQQEPKQGCNYGTQIQGALLSENAQEQEKNKPAPDVPEEKPAQPEKQKWRPQKSEESRRREADVKRAKEKLKEVLGVAGQAYIDVDTHGEKVIEFLKEGIAKGISKDIIEVAIEALEKFKDVEGFLDLNGPVSKILLECLVDIPHQSTVNGAIYEIEVALKESKHSKIIRFGEKVQVPKIGERDIDLETEEKLIECKNTLWSEKEVEKVFNYKQAREKISQIKKKPFEIASKGPIPDQLKKWLIKNSIPYSEGL